MVSVVTDDNLFVVNDYLHTHTHSTAHSNSIIFQPHRPVSFSYWNGHAFVLSREHQYMYTKAKRNIYKNEMDHYTIHLQQLFSLRQFKIAAQRICVCATSSVLLYKKRGLDPLYSTHSNNIINNCGWKCRDIFYLNIIPFSLVPTLPK